MGVSPMSLPAEASAKVGTTGILPAYSLLNAGPGRP